VSDQWSHWWELAKGYCSRCCRCGNRGAAIIEYVGITAVALLLAAAIIGYLRSDGLSSIAQAVAQLIDGTIEAFEAADTVRFR
jgi:hypothetical protein